MEIPEAATTVRPAAPDDAEGLAEVHVLSWQAAYRGLMPQEHLDGLSVPQKVPLWRERLAQLRPPQAVYVLGPAVAGFVMVGAGEEPGVGAVMAIYLRPEHWRQGGGKALMAVTIKHLQGYGFTEATLWVLDTNVRARRFYESAGWQPDGATQIDDSRGYPRIEIRYRRALV